MPKFNVTVPHSLSAEEATGRLEHFVEVLREKFQDQVSELEQSWEAGTLNFRFKTYGIPLSGKINVTDSALVMDGDLPFTAMMFSGKIESAIREQLERLVRS
jgi:Putative polyhydroxyalkanoic acid system protein (PHA_gran_rgn)